MPRIAKKAAPAKKVVAKTVKSKPAAAEPKLAAGEVALTQGVLEKLNKLAADIDAIRAFIQSNGAAKARAKAAPVAEEAEEKDEREERQAELEELSLPGLRKLALGDDYRFDPKEVKGADKETLIESILSVDFDEEDEDEEEGDEEETEEEESDDEEEEDEEELTKESLMALPLSELKRVARENGIGVKELKGKDSDEISDLVLEAIGEEDEEDEDEEDDDYYTEEELGEMSIPELKELCDESGIQYRKNASQGALIKAILESGEEEE